MLVDTNGEIADDVLVDAEQALDLHHRLGGPAMFSKVKCALRFFLMRKASDLSPQGSAACSDHAPPRRRSSAKLLRQSLDLLRRDVLAHAGKICS